MSIIANCPLCESSNAEPLIRDGQAHVNYVRCKDCHARTGNWGTREAAIKAWNRRPAMAVPDGWKLVPIEPTEEMLSAADSAIPQAVRDYQTGIRMMGREVAFECYRAMLSAAPAIGESEK